VREGAAQDCSVDQIIISALIYLLLHNEVISTPSWRWTRPHEGPRQLGPGSTRRFLCRGLVTEFRDRTLWESQGPWDWNKWSSRGFVVKHCLCGVSQLSQTGSGFNLDRNQLVQGTNKRDLKSFRPTHTNLGFKTYFFQNYNTIVYYGLVWIPTKVVLLSRNMYSCHRPWRQKYGVVSFPVLPPFHLKTNVFSHPVTLRL
jgi:hypothetical protein